MEDADQRLIATATSRFFAWGTVADITDPDGHLIGTIQEEVIRILPWAEYNIFNAENERIAIAKMDFLGTAFTIYNPNNPEDIYATITRPLIHLYFDSWTLQIVNESVDHRMILLLAVLQTDKDNKDRSRNEWIDRWRIEHDSNDLRQFE